MAEIYFCENVLGIGKYHQTNCQLNYNFQHWAMEELLYNSMIGVSLLNYHKTKQRGGGYGI
jgi:hypothetical protein